MKVQHKQDLVDFETKKNKQKEKELDILTKKFEKIIEELKRNAKNDREHMERDYKTQIEKLEADLKESRKGFEHEREILLKQQKEM